MLKVIALRAEALNGEQIEVVKVLFIVFNFAGIVMAAAAFGIAFGIGKLIGKSGEGPLTLIGGGLLMLFDLAYRLSRKEGHWLTPNKGGSLFFLPAWCFGALWVVLGTVYTVRGK